MKILLLTSVCFLDRKKLLCCLFRCTEVVLFAVVLGTDSSFQGRKILDVL